MEIKGKKKGQSDEVSDCYHTVFLPQIRDANVLLALVFAAASRDCYLLQRLWPERSSTNVEKKACQNFPRLADPGNLLE